MTRLTNAAEKQVLLIPNIGIRIAEVKSAPRHEPKRSAP